MKNLILFSVCVALAFALALAPSPARAGDEFKAALTSSDAGSTNTATMGPGLTYSLQCASEACYKTGTTASLSATCTQDFLLQASNNCPLSVTVQDTVDGGEFLERHANGSTKCIYQRDFQSGAHTRIVARAVDGGNPACNLYQHHKNP